MPASPLPSPYKLITNLCIFTATALTVSLTFKQIECIYIIKQNGRTFKDIHTDVTLLVHCYIQNFYDEIGRVDKYPVKLIYL